MKRVLLGAAVVTAMMLFAAPAFAEGTGYMEICKYSSGLSGTPTFKFDVSGIGGAITVDNNSCSRPFRAPAGQDTVFEQPGSWYTVSAISTDPGSALISSNPQGSGALNTGPNGTSVVTVNASNAISSATVVNYTNAPVYGYVEVCKSNASDSGLTGTWYFKITGHNGFQTPVYVPIGHCSFPILVPAGQVTIQESQPNDVTSITVQNGSPYFVALRKGRTTVNVKPEPSSGDESQEAIVTFYNQAVQLKVCKVASDPGVTQPYTFTVLGTGDPSYPNGITESVTMLPGQCQLVPGPYTNPNGTTGWRAGTTVTTSEGVVPGTAVTGIIVEPSNREVPGSLMLSPLPNPTLPGPAGSVAAVLGSGETLETFYNDSEPNGTLKICETDANSPGTSFTFTVSSPTPAGSNTTATVPAGSCTIVPNPVTSDGLWLYNSTVTITQTGPSGFSLIPPIAVNPTARMLSQSGSTVNVAIGSGDTTIVTYTNDPPAPPPSHTRASALRRFERMMRPVRRV
jgi:hypothetical protein